MENLTVLEHIGNAFAFIGGLGMFLYGMSLMSAGLQKVAGTKMKDMLNNVTKKRIMGILIGAMITAIIQSSGATTVMVVGFVNAGILNLTQSVGVIMGANIGTTITAWIVSLDSLGEAATVLKPSFYAPLLVGIGAFLVMFSKKNSRRTWGDIIIAIGLLFVGLSTMSTGMSPYMKSEIVQNSFLTLGQNPLLGLLIGIVVTGLMQSSSASVGVLQTMAGYGIVPASVAVFICLGADIGSTFTALLSSMGASRPAKRAALINLLFNLFGVIFWGILIFIFFQIFPATQNIMMTSVYIAIFHTGFKVCNTTLFYPFAPKLVKIAEWLIPEKEEEKPVVEKDDVLMLVDERILNTPSFGISVMNDYVSKLGHICLDNITRGLDAVMYGKYELLPDIYATEKHIDAHVEELSNFMVKLSNAGLNDKQSTVVKDLMYTTIDLERVGDHAENLADLATKMQNQELKFSEPGLRDLEEMREVLIASLSNAVLAREKASVEHARACFHYEDEVNACEENLREKHIERLSRRECNSDTGIIFLDILTNLERVSDHAVNIAGYVKDEA